MIMSCEFCGQTFELPVLHQNKRFCSVKCKHAARKKRLKTFVAPVNDAERKQYLLERERRRDAMRRYAERVEKETWPQGAGHDGRPTTNDSASNDLLLVRLKAAHGPDGRPDIPAELARRHNDGSQSRVREDRG